MKVTIAILSVWFAGVFTIIYLNPDSKYHNTEMCKHGKMSACEFLVGQRNRENPNGNYSDYSTEKLQKETVKMYNSLKK